MKRATYAALLTEVIRRNETMAAQYAAAGRTLISRPLARLAAMAAQQRQDLVPQLAAMATELDPGLAAGVLDLADELFALPAMPESGGMDTKRLVELFRQEEERDRELFSLLAEKAATVQPDLSEELLQVADAARKRAATAADHLALLGMTGG